MLYILIFSLLVFLISLLVLVFKRTRFMVNLTLIFAILVILCFVTTVYLARNGV